MLKNMLKAVSKMLDGKQEPEVKCAKVIIDQLIEELAEKDLKVLAPQPTAHIDDTSKSAEKVEGTYEIVVDNGKLVEIKGLDLDALIEVDGKKLKHREAIGRNFKHGRIL